MIKPIEWMGSTRDDVRDMPDGARAEVGFALFQAQCGGKGIPVSTMVGFGGGKTLEVVVPENGDAFRAVYTVKFPQAVYVLHAFKNKV